MKHFCLKCKRLLGRGQGYCLACQQEIVEELKQKKKVKVEQKISKK